MASRRRGVAYGMRFPDSNTPTEVVAAWEEATADLSPSERMIYELQMVTPIITANIHLDENGAYSHHLRARRPQGLSIRLPIQAIPTSRQRKIG